MQSQVHLSRHSRETLRPSLRDCGPRKPKMDRDSSCPKTLAETASSPPPASPPPWVAPSSRFFVESCCPPPPPPPPSSCEDAEVEDSPAACRCRWLSAAASASAADRRSDTEVFSARKATQVEMRSLTRPAEQATTAARLGPRVGIRLVAAEADGLAPLVLISTSACQRHRHRGGGGGGRGRRRPKKVADVMSQTGSKCIYRVTHAHAHANIPRQARPQKRERRRREIGSAGEILSHRDALAAGAYARGGLTTRHDSAQSAAMTRNNGCESITEGLTVGISPGEALDGMGLTPREDKTKEQGGGGHKWEWRQEQVGSCRKRFCVPPSLSSSFGAQKHYTAVALGGGE